VSAETLPLINAILNGISTILLVTGYILIKRRKYRAHAAVMITAFAFSALFLVGYLAHKAMFPDKSSGLEPGLLKSFYLFVILFPHILLAMVMLPMILLTLRHACKGRWDKHKRLARPTFWIWLYVSVTGVIIYWMLYHLFPAMQA
jgi:uncharacterized membrane protein YozB (DUF420 family)